MEALEADYATAVATVFAVLVYVAGLLDGKPEFVQPVSQSQPCAPPREGRGGHGSPNPTRVLVCVCVKVAIAAGRAHAALTRHLGNIDGDIAASMKKDK